MLCDQASRAVIKSCSSYSMCAVITSPYRHGSDFVPPGAAVSDVDNVDAYREVISIVKHGQHDIHDCDE